MTAFCGADDRLMGMACISLDDPTLAVKELEFALASGLKGIWVPHRICGDKSPDHPDFEPFWSMLAESGVPFLTRFGGSNYHIDPTRFSNGKLIPNIARSSYLLIRNRQIVIAHLMNPHNEPNF
jgi:predicted TIM-barrel fold metal-dependent hydrolase